MILSLLEDVPVTTPATIDVSALFTGLQSTVMGAFVTIVPLAISLFSTIYMLQAAKKLFAKMAK